MKFGTVNGKTIEKYTLTNGVISIDVLTFGAIIQSLRVPDKNGVLTDIVLGYNTIEEYVNDDAYVGAIVGRVCNCISNGLFNIDGKEYVLSRNCGKNSNHGGFEGFNKKIWNCDEYTGDKIVLSYLSKDGEEGYPGNLKIKVVYSITERNGFRVEYSAVSDKDTLVNLTNHMYYNLNGESDGKIDCQSLCVLADKITPVDKDLITYNEYMEVENTPYDFRKEKFIDKDIDSNHPQIVNGNGYDINYVLKGDGFRKVAYAEGKKTGIRIEAYTDRCGMQLYTANSLGKRKGKNGFYKDRSGFCLEFQHFPNAINCKEYTAPLLKKGETYSATTEIVFR
ncbi:MAG: galactose mutarotase [Clostridia bacterium]|nr:galactose mutarotase [Clostridia bacterium]